MLSFGRPQIVLLALRRRRQAGGAPPAMENRDDAMVSDGGPVLRRAVTR